MKTESELVKSAMEFAARVHAHKTYDEYPYFKHLEDVAKVLWDYGYKSDVFQASAFLHDSMEDTGTSYSDLKKRFGEEIAEIVYCMTDEIGRNRKEKKEKTLPKIRSNPDSIIVKIADRIANMMHGINSEKGGADFVKMYCDEHKAFRWALYVPNHCDRMWAELDRIVIINRD